MTTRVFTDQRCLLHRSPPGYPERSERLEAIVDHLAGEGHEIVDSVAFPEVEERIRNVHDPAYVERLRRAVERGDGLIDSADNPLSEGTFDASLAAVETVLTAAEWVMGETDRKALAAVRPPGHHAEHGTAMGFCYFNNVAVAADHLIDRHGLGRVAIFDFDVHHGNGTQHLFEERGDVLYVSTHQYPFYPGTGAANERGRGDRQRATAGRNRQRGLCCRSRRAGAAGARGVCTRGADAVSRIRRLAERPRRGHAGYRRRLPRVEPLAGRPCGRSVWGTGVVGSGRGLRPDGPAVTGGYP
ncbi:MAG: histone deacetylase, partial [Acidobacteria bacterium]